MVLALAGGGWWLLNRGAIADYKNIAYTIEGERVELHDGITETSATPGSATKVVTQFFGNVGKGDLNGDGIPDLAFLLTQNSGGSGTFYYVVGAIQTVSGGYIGTAGVLLGDRIAPQTTEIRDGVVIVNYADRAWGEPMTASPSVGKTLRLKLDPKSMQFVEVDQNLVALKRYSNAAYGLSFSYPETYVLSEIDAPGSGMRVRHSITLLRKEDLPLPEGGEGPPAITIEAFQNDLDKQTTEGWIKNTSASSYKLSEGTLAATTVNGLPALSYRWSGLYEGTTIALAMPNWIYVFTVTYLEMGAPIVQDFVAIRDNLRIAR